ncbi:DNA topoisomerase 3-alpha [Bienertia sinuspersici]
MSARRGCSFGSGSPSNSSRRLLQNRVKCNCDNDAVIRTVRNGPNAGSKFYGCPLWPDTKCEMFKLINGTNVAEELQSQLLEMEVVQKFKDDKIKKLQSNKGSLEQELGEMRCEMNQVKIDIMKSNTDIVNLKLDLFAVCVLFIIMYCLK